MDNITIKGNVSARNSALREQAHNQYVRPRLQATDFMVATGLRNNVGIRAVGKNNTCGSYIAKMTVTT